MSYSPVLTPTVFYQDPAAAMKWLADAFGFETAMLVTGDDGKVVHAEMAFRNAVIGIAGEWTGDPKLGGAKMLSPRTLDGAATQFIWVSLKDGIDAHCEAARAAGAQITQAPEDQVYGSRTYRARDPEGHVWCFSQEMRAVSDEEMAKSGWKITKPLEETAP